MEMTLESCADKILIVEDDPNVAELLRTYLHHDGFDVMVQQDGRLGLVDLQTFQPALVLLDIRLPRMDGWEFCKRVRRYSSVPIIMLTSQISEADRIAGLSMGADDYVVKPFSPREVVERVKAVLRRAPAEARGAAAKPMIDMGLVVSPDKAEVTLDGQQIGLTLSEFRILHTLMGSAGRVFTRDELLDHLHDQSVEVVDRIVDVHIGNLRRKIEKDPSSPRLILTVRGIGYKFREIKNERGTR